MRRPEAGHAAIEIVILTPLLLILLLVVVAMGRMAHARQQVESVAADAARAASLERNTALSATAAKQAANASLGAAGMSCSGLTVGVDVSNYQPGGRVTVTVSCTARLADLTMAGFPGLRTYRATSTVPIETWRSN